MTPDRVAKLERKSNVRGVANVVDVSREREYLVLDQLSDRMRTVLNDAWFPYQPSQVIGLVGRFGEEKVIEMIRAQDRKNWGTAA